MRFLFSVLGILLVVALVGLLAKKQFSSLSESQRGAPPAAGQASPAEGARPAGSPRQQIEQVQKSVQDLMQQARPMPEGE